MVAMQLWRCRSKGCRRAAQPNAFYCCVICRDKRIGFDGGGHGRECMGAFLCPTAKAKAMKAKAMEAKAMKAKAMKAKAMGAKKQAKAMKAKAPAFKTLKK